MNFKLTSLTLVCALLLMAQTAFSQSIFINEIHYDNDGSDANEGIEIAGPAGTDLSAYTLELYNGNGGSLYDAVSLSGTLPDLGAGFGVIFFPISGIQNGSPDGVALVHGDTIVQFLSYEGAFVATGGTASGLSSEDIGVEEAGNTPLGHSLQLTGTGTLYRDFDWSAANTSTYNGLNTGQSFGTPDTSEVVEITTLFINEIHYDNDGTDVSEGVEVAGTSGGDLAGYSLVLYNGNGGTVYSTTALGGIIPDQQNGFGTIFFPIAGMQNGSPDGMALVDPNNTVLQFLSYEGTFAAAGGPADGLSSTDIGVAETSSTAAGLSLQLQGSGNQYEDFTWAAEIGSTTGLVNTGQTFLPVQQVAFINEIHYDNSGTDEGEAIEIAGSAGLDLTGWSLVLYNGNDGTAYNITTLSGTLPNQDNGYGVLFFSIPGIQNGAPDGLALIDPEDSVVQFLSYEGAFLATDGPAAGMSSEDIGVAETTSTPINSSLQLTGSGFTYADFAWADAGPATFGTVNSGQYFGSTPDTTGTDSLVVITIAEARTKPLGASVIISGILTATDQFGGPAFIQDATAGISIFDSQIHGVGNYALGDELQIRGTLDAFSQMIQVVNVMEIDTLSTGNIITPDTITLGELGAHEGELVTIVDVTFDDPSGIFYPGSNYVINDAAGTAELRIDAEVESLVGKLKPRGLTTVTGVVGRFNTTLQLLPRFAADLPGVEEYVPGGSGISHDSTLDIATWNMEFFGSSVPNYGPSDVVLQRENARTVIAALDADIIAVQEVSETDILDVLLDSLEGYARVCSDVYSYSFDPDDTFPAQKLCFIYNTNTVTLTGEQVLFEQFYNDARTGATSGLDDYPTGSAQSFWASGRLPYMMTASVNIQGTETTIRLINIHAKSGSATSDIARKAYDAQALKDTLDAHYPNDQVIILGDYNDDVDESIGGGTTPYQPYVADSLNFDPVTAVLSANGFRSYLFANNMIDHITITDKLFDSYIANSASTFIPFNLISNYSGTTSDHLPVVARFNLVPPVEPLVLSSLADIELIKGYGEKSITVEAMVTGGLAPYSYSWSNGSQDPYTSVSCETTDSLLILTITDAAGQVASDTAAILIDDVTCSKGWGWHEYKGVQMCNGRASVCVSEHFVDHFLDKGFQIGDCDFMVRMSCRASNDPWKHSQTLYFDFNIEANVSVKIYNWRGDLEHDEEILVPAGETAYEVALPYRGLFYVRLGSTGDEGFEATFRMIRLR